MKKALVKSLLLGLAGTFMASAALACTPIGAGRNATVDGSVMVSHTCDGWYDNRIQIIPGQTFEAGATTPVYQDVCHGTQPTRPLKKVLDIPQVEKTYTYFHIGYPFMNEHQLVFGEDTWSGRDELYAKDGAFWIETLEIFGLQRAKTAREAIKVMGELAEEYGYGDGGETLIIADTKELWVFDICGPGMLWNKDSGKPGAIWAARRVPDDHVVVCANRSRIGVIDFEDKDNFMYSSNVTDLAKEMGWWKPGSPFNFSEAYNPNPYGSGHYQSIREWRGFNLLAPSKNFELTSQKSHYPFSAKPDKKVAVKDIMAIYRDHLEGTEYDLTKGMAAGPFGNPHRWPTPKDVRPEGKKDKDWPRAISMFRCSYSFVSQSREWLPDPVGGVLWFGQDAPDTTIYVPLYCGVTKVPAGWSEGKRHEFDPNSAWWAFNFVNNWAQLRWDSMIKDVNAEQQKWEKEFFMQQNAVEKEAVDLYKKDPKKAVAYLTDYTYGNMEKVQNAMWGLAWKLVGKYQDGYIMTPEGKQQSVGYPTWWLEAVGFGEDFKD
ncbi:MULTISPECIES: dipeptidase [Dethiosulfovibrio]|uniref:Dipeptidase n=2 Tax=Dethiosulfovibrio TaxID=47054 RepID=A0ABS9ERI5_9BACT|nr:MULTISPECIES: C69 family dipeptidase [Dethiosulfovibrio]MCF4114053.1 C69 family dipeptidase [Dethiosulfovibrio russensis]MCF4142757.1 C69 family dipeptidase [Dethiosulfovibrio marinus]MCF4144679.1 C69 family dipeptidase [Dethiosulfovibrio acidaminovorans]